MKIIVVALALLLPSDMVFAESGHPGSSETIAMLPRVDLRSPADGRSSRPDQAEPAHFRRWLRTNDAAVHAVCVDCPDNSVDDTLR